MALQCALLSLTNCPGAAALAGKAAPSKKGKAGGVGGGKGKGKK